MATDTPQRKSIVLNDEAILNSYSSRVMTAGIDLVRFLKNPVMLFSHERHKAPIGKWTNIRKEGGRLLADPEFDAGDAEAMELKRKWDAGYLNGASIGVGKPIKFSAEIDHLLPGQEAESISHSVLYEASIVSVPSNEDCLSFAGSAVVTIPTLTRANFTMTEEQLQLLGLSADASPDQITAELKRLRGVEVEVALSAAEAKGIVTADNKESMRTVATADLATFSAIVQAAPVPSVVEPAKPEAPKQEPPAPKVKTLTELIRIHGTVSPHGGNTAKGDKARSEWTFSDYERKDPDALLEIKRNDPNRYDEMCDEYATQKSARP